MVNNRAKPPNYNNNLISLVGVGIAVMLVLAVIIFIATSPTQAIGTTALPEAIHPIPINVGPGPTGPVGPTATAMPVPTATPAPTPVPTATPEVTVANQPTPVPQPTVTPLPTALPPLPGVDPVRLRIPNLGINAAVETVGLDSQNRMDVPKNIWNVAWYKLGAKPGERGNAVIDGHLDGEYSAAVFWNLNQLKPGNRIYVDGPNKQQLVFEVYEIDTYDYNGAPMDRIFGPSDQAGLNLITCGGDFDQKTYNYNKRFVAYTHLVQNP